jgi:hypothetical protein
MIPLAGVAEKDPPQLALGVQPTAGWEWLESSAISPTARHEAVNGMNFPCFWNAFSKKLASLVAQMKLLQEKHWNRQGLEGDVRPVEPNRLKLVA